MSRALLSLLVLPVLTAACDGVTRIRTGLERAAILVVTETEGDPADADGYTAVAIDPLGQRSVAEVGVTDSVVLGDLRAELEYEVTLEDVSAPCAVSDEDPKRVFLEVRDTARVPFEIVCPAG